VGSSRPDRPVPPSAFDLATTGGLLARYQWVETRLFEVMGGWVATVPDLDVKVCFGAHCYHHAWHADLWQQRRPNVATTAAAENDLAPFVEALSTPTDTLERLVGVFRVLLPHKIGAYTAHLQLASPISDAPTIRSLRLVMNDELNDWREGELLIQSLVTTGAEAERAARHQARLESLLVAAGGVPGRRPES
jgi:hypothetical protein